VNYDPKRPSLLFYDFIGQRLWLRTRWFQAGIKRGLLFPDRFWINPKLIRAREAEGKK
jgi:hypothetical protein